MYLILIFFSVTAPGECLSLDVINSEIKFLPCSEQRPFICQVNQKPHPDKIEAMKLPYYINPLDSVTETITESFVGFSDISVPKTELYSAASFMGDATSYLTDKPLLPGLSTQKGFTFSFWINPGKIDGEQNIFSIDNIIHLYMTNGEVTIKLCHISGDPCEMAVAHQAIEVLQWNYVAVVYDSISSIGTLFINETYGVSDAESTFVTVENLEFNTVFDEFPTILFGKNKDGDKTLTAKLSCFQYFDKPLSKSQIYQMSKVCHVHKEYIRAKTCPEDSILIDKVCYKLSEKPMSYVEAQMTCTSPPNSKRISRLAYPSKFQYQQNLLVMAKNNKSAEAIFMGLDSMSGISTFTCIGSLTVTFAYYKLFHI